MAVSRDYVNMTARVPPATKAQIDLLGALEGKSAGHVIATAVQAYVESLPAQARKALDDLRAIRLRSRGRRVGGERPSE